MSKRAGHCESVVARIVIVTGSVCIVCLFHSLASRLSKVRIATNVFYDVATACQARGVPTFLVTAVRARMFVPWGVSSAPWSRLWSTQSSPGGALIRGCPFAGGLSRRARRACGEAALAVTAPAAFVPGRRGHSLWEGARWPTTQAAAAVTSVLGSYCCRRVRGERHPLDWAPSAIRLRRRTVCLCGERSAASLACVRMCPFEPGCAPLSLCAWCRLVCAPAASVPILFASGRRGHLSQYLSQPVSALFLCYPRSRVSFFIRVYPSPRHTRQ